MDCGAEAFAATHDSDRSGPRAKETRNLLDFATFFRIGILFSNSKCPFLIDWAGEITVGPGGHPHYPAQWQNVKVGQVVERHHEWQLN